MTKVYEKHQILFRVNEGQLEHSCDLLYAFPWSKCDREIYNYTVQDCIQDCIDQREDSPYLVKEEDR